MEQKTERFFAIPGSLVHMLINFFNDHEHPGTKHHEIAGYINMLSRLPIVNIAPVQQNENEEGKDA